MDSTKHEFASTAERAQAMQDAEALSRRRESEALVLQGRVSRARTPEAFKTELEERVKAGDEAQKELDRLAEASAKPDLSGVSRGLSDSEGNFAANAEVAAVGGIGIDGSNSKEGSSEPAQTADEAGTATLPGAQKIIGDQPVGGESTAIPADWQEQHWTKQVKLAEQISGKDDLNAAEARQILEAEAAKRG